MTRLPATSSDLSDSRVLSRPQSPWQTAETIPPLLPDRAGDRLQPRAIGKVPYHRMTASEVDRVETGRSDLVGPCGGRHRFAVYSVRRTRLLSRSGQVARPVYVLFFRGEEFHAL